MSKQPAFAPRISPETPLRRAITQATRIPEPDAVRPLLAAATLPEADRARIAATARALIEALRAKATAAADVSDGLIADAGHIATASQVELQVQLDRLPLSGPARDWVAAQPDPADALLHLATGGDDYEIVATFAGDPPEGFTAIGRVTPGSGVSVRFGANPVAVGRRGWTHI